MSDVIDPITPDSQFTATWFSRLDHREVAQVMLAIEYARNHASAGAPGHSQFMLIAKLVSLLNDRTLVQEAR